MPGDGCSVSVLHSTHAIEHIIFELALVDVSFNCDEPSLAALKIVLEEAFVNASQSGSIGSESVLMASLLVHISDVEQVMVDLDLLPHSWNSVFQLALFLICSKFLSELEHLGSELQEFFLGILGITIELHAYISARVAVLLSHQPSGKKTFEGRLSLDDLSQYVRISETQWLLFVCCTAANAHNSVFYYYILSN